jgi:leucyl-tRNA synthetase
LPVKVGITQSEVEQLVRDSDKVQKYLDGKAPKKVIYVPDKLVNIVI